MPKIDMSEQAILRRLRTVERLRELCLALMKAKSVNEENMRDHESDRTGIGQNSVVSKGGSGASNH